MNIKEAKLEAINAIKTYLLKDEDGNYVIPIHRQRPIVIMGPAGIGKTDFAKQVSEELEIGFLSYTITHHTRQSAVGLPKLVNKIHNGEENIVTEYTMSEIISSIYDYIEKYDQPNGILFIDEFNCASETLAATMLQFLQNKTFGMNKVPDGWKIILAGNPHEYNKSVKELDIVTMDRLRIINVVPDFDAWKEYAILKNIHPSILAYLSQKQSSLCSFSNDNNGRQLVTPRGWEELSHTIWVYKNLNLEVNLNVISQFINHKKISMEFANYYNVFTNIITNEEVESILDGKADKKISDRLKRSGFDIRCSIVWILTNHLQASANEYNKLTDICDELYSALKNYKEKESLENLKKTDLSTNSKAYMDKLFKETNDLNFEETFKKIKSKFEELTLNRERSMTKTDSMVTNILSFIKTTFDNGGEMEIFLSNISIDKNIVKLLIETGNKSYLSCNTQFIENFKADKMTSRIKKIS